MNLKHALTKSSNKIHKVLFKVFQDDRCLSRSYSLTVNEWGREPIPLDEIITSGVQFYRNSGIRNKGYKVHVFIDKQFHNIFEI